MYAGTDAAPFLSVITDDCIRKGKDYNAGGARYNHTLHPVCRHRHPHGQPVRHQAAGVRRRGEMPLGRPGRDPRRGLRRPRAAPPAARQPHAQVRQRRRLRRRVDGLRVPHAILGESTAGRTPRAARTASRCCPPRATSISARCHRARPTGGARASPCRKASRPVQGADRHGPTAVVKSASKMDHVKTGGTLLNMKFAPDLLEGERGIDGLHALVRSYFKLDGHHVQFNVVTADTLRAGARPTRLLTGI